MSYPKGIEVGHIFQLGTRYSKPLECNFLDENGKSQPMVMGTYGIGVSRLLAAIIEQHHDDRGCIWTKESAPFDCYIMISNIKDEAQVKLAQELYDELKSQGVDVLLDDRKDRFGAKMKDYELLGIPKPIKSLKTPGIISKIAPIKDAILASWNFFISNLPSPTACIFSMIVNGAILKVAKPIDIVASIQTTLPKKPNSSPNASEK